MILPEITKDILKVIRASNISKDETIPIRQIESWVHQFRAELIMRALNKGDMIDESWVQDMKCLELEIVDRAECLTVTLDSDCDVLKTTTEVPNVVRYSSGTGLLGVGSITGKPYQIVSKLRGYYQKHRPYTFDDRVAWHENKYIYVTGEHGLKYISLQGIFANPVDLSTYINNCSDSACYDIDTEDYPASVEMIAAIRDMIMEKIMPIELKVYSDKDNDSQNILTSNVTK